jgi:SAM-dependent methyltransferase
MRGPDPDDYLNPVCTAATIDTVLVRRSILNALRAQLPALHGTVLDVGCGHSPYRSLVLGAPSRADRYIGLDLAGTKYGSPDLTWDGRHVDLPDGSVDCALATEVLEHCPDPGLVLRETRRLLRPGGLLFFTVPFLWPLHDTPNDEYRLTPFSLGRLLREAGYADISLQALGGWDASLAQLIGLWVRRRPMSARRRRLLTRLALPVVRFLAGRDSPPREFTDNCMLTGLAGTARKPAA